MIAGYVIIGGGSAGVRLSKTPTAWVVVIESRGPKRRPVPRLPIGAFS